MERGGAGEFTRWLGGCPEPLGRLNTRVGTLLRMLTGHADPYRDGATVSSARKRPRHVQDMDVLVLLAILSPAFLAVTVHTVLRGETWGVGSTVCAGIVVLAVALVVSAWCARDFEGPA